MTLTEARRTLLREFFILYVTNVSLIALAQLLFP